MLLSTRTKITIRSTKAGCRERAFIVNSLCLVWEVMFYAANPDHLFTCSQDGAIWQWNGSSMKAPSIDINKILNPSTPGIPNASSNMSSTPTPWLSADASKHKIETFSLLPYNRPAVNSMDVTGQNLVCGTDGEAVYILDNLDLGV